MKKLLLLLGLSLFIMNTQAQLIQCDPDPECNEIAPGEGAICPEELAPGIVEEYYDETITIIPLAEYGDYDIYSLRLDDIQGLPEGVEWGKSDEEFIVTEPFTRYCIKIYGTPENAGEFQLELYLTPFVWVYPPVGDPMVMEGTQMVDDTTFLFIVNEPIIQELNCPEDFSVCINEEPFQLTGAEPEGGTYTGPGIDLENPGIFDPVLAEIGPHTITYTYEETECTFIIVVNDIPEVLCPDDIFVCIDDEPFELIGASPEGGEYTGGPGLDGLFYPSSAGVGTDIITYTYTDIETGCENSCTFNITVNDLPEVLCLDDFIITYNEPVELGPATPIDGIYSGIGVIDGFFDPDGLANGNYTITYTYVDDNYCENYCEFIITINIEGFPDIICPDDMAVCIDNEPFELTGGLPEGGIWTGNGLIPGVPGIFDPELAGAGNHVITYTYNEMNCEFAIIVHDLPLVDEFDNIEVCGNFMLPELTNGSYFTETGGSGTPLSAGNNIASTQTIYIYNESGTIPNCTNESNFTVTVYDLPEVICPEDIFVCIDDEPFELIGASPEGGEYTGSPGLDGLFYPSGAGVGTDIITYTYTDIETGCENFCTFNITVNDLPEVLCPDDFIVTENEPVELGPATPIDGIYSGIGVIDGFFDPEGLANGNYTITYTYVDGNNCENYCEFIITIDIVDFPDIICPEDMTVCLNDEPFELTGGLPEGYTYLGMGVTDGFFNPNGAATGPGTYTITYIQDEDINCEFTITVNDLPEVICPEDITVEEIETIVLTGATPVDGTYSGIGITDGETFNPDGLENGEYVITYTFTDSETGCENYCDFIITVDIPSGIICPEDIVVCRNDEPFELTGAEPEGGEYSGYGVSEGIFNPEDELTGPGTYTITYIYNEDGCEFSITVNELPIVTCPDDFTVEVNEPVDLTDPTHEGGTYSGEGVTDGIFDPDGLENGEYVITYTFTDPETGCENSCEFTITVDIEVGIITHKDSRINIYPNPNNGMFVIDFSNIDGKLSYEIYDTKGSIILKEDVSNKENQKEINIDVPAGVYFIRLVNAKETIIEKIIVN